MNTPSSPTARIALFHGKEIRKILYNNEWWFVVEDVVLVLTDSADPKQYIRRIRERDPELEKGWVQFVRTLDVETQGGTQKMNCSNTEGIFRFTMLGEAATTEITQKKDAQGFRQNRETARKGGKIAGDARKKLELESGKPVVSEENYLDLPGNNQSPELSQ